MRSDEFPNKEDKLFIPEKVGHSGCPKASMISFIYQKAIEWLLLLFLKKSKKENG